MCGRYMFCAYISIIGMLLPNFLDFIVLEISTEHMDRPTDIQR